MSNPYGTQPSQIISEYRLVRKLGGGGFSTVYLAEPMRERSQVAIKVLRVPLTKREDFRAFLNETRTMIRLRHPHIIPLLDVGLSRGDFPFLVMEYAPEGTLRNRHPRGSQVPLATIAEYIEQIAEALQYAHDHRVIHRDVKPENILLRTDGTLLLSDFGIAKIMEQSTFMSMQKLAGTPAYMAPEQHKGYPCTASDQYALAVLAYEWISGTLPFQGTPLGLVVQHMTQAPFSLLNLLPTLPPSLEQVIFKALCKDASQRFATVEEFATALRAAVQEATFSAVNVKKLPLDESPAKEALIQRSTTTASIHTEAPIDTPPVPHLPPTDEPIESEPEIDTPSVPQSPSTEKPIETDSEKNTPPVSSPPPGDLSNEPDAQIKQSSSQMSNPLSSNPPKTPNPSLSPVAAIGKPSSAVKAFRRFSPLRRKLFLMGSGLLVVLLILALVISMRVVNLQHPPKNRNAVPGHTPYNEPLLNANTASRLGEKWIFQTESPVYSSPAVVGGVVYIGSDDHNVYAIDAQSGQKKWAFLTRDGVVSSPTVVGGVVYIGSDDHNVYAIDAQSGQKKWAFPTGSIVHSPPAVVDGVVYVGSDDSSVYAIDAQSGQKKWAFSTAGSLLSSEAQPPPVSSRPAVADGVVYVGAADSSVYAIDALSGQKKWAFSTAGSLLSSPTVVDRVVYVGSSGRFGSFEKDVYAIDTQSGHELWTFHTAGTASSLPPRSPLLPRLPPRAVSSCPAVVGGVVYVGAENGNVYAIDALSGQKKWAFSTQRPVVSSPAVIDGVVYVGTLSKKETSEKNVYAIDAQSGHQIWAFHTGGAVFSSPAVVDSVVYVGSSDGRVYAFGLPAS